MLAPVLNARRRSPAPALAHCRSAGRITDPVCVTLLWASAGPTGLGACAETRAGPGLGASSPQALRVAPPAAQG